MTSFDGLRYDAQTLGEYIYTQPIDGGDGPTLIVRHETFNPAVTTFAATAITGAHISDGGVGFEVTERPEGVYLDGEPFDLASGESFLAAPDVKIERIGTAWRFTSPDIVVNIVIRGREYLDVSATVRLDGELVGLLGIPDGDTDNDLLIRDVTRPVEEWDSISLPLARAQSTDFYAFSDSWRLTDPQDSPFTVFDAVFDEPNRLPASFGFLEPFREQARAFIAASQQFCGGDPIDLEWAVEAFAIEFAAGLDETYPACGFVLSGLVVTDDPAVPVEGIEVAAGAPGLRGCATLTDRFGQWSCVVSPDPSDPQPDVVFPYDVDVTVEADAPAGPAGGVVVQLPERAVMNSDLVVASAPDVVIPVDRAVVVEASGTLASSGVPVTSPTKFDVLAFDADGNRLRASLLTVTPDGSGAYDEAIALPTSIASVEFTWRVGLSGDHPTATADGLVPGANPFRFDADYQPVRLQVSGIATRNGAPMTDGRLEVSGTRSNGSTYRFSTAVVTEADGAYVVQGQLPSDVIQVELALWEGLKVNAVRETFDVAPGENALVFDAAVVAPRLNVSGAALVNGEPIGSFVLNVDDGTGVRRLNGRVSTPGTYATLIDLPAGTTTVELSAAIGIVDADDPTLTVENITDADIDVTFDAVVAGPVLLLEGTQTASGVPDPRRFSIVVTGADGFRSTKSVVPDEFGDYQIDFQLPSTITEVDVAAGQGGALAPVQTFTGLVVGPNERTIDVDAPGVVLDISGDLSVDGVPVSRVVNLQVEAVDASGDAVSFATFAVAASDGSYSTRHFLPASAVDVGVRALLGTWSSTLPADLTEDLQLGLNPITVDVDYSTTILDVTGEIDSGDVGLAGGRTFVIEMTLDDPTAPGGQRTITSTRQVVLDFDGTFDFEFEIPETTIRAVIIAQVAQLRPDDPRVVVDPILPGVTPVEFIADVPVPVEIDVTGSVADAAGPVDGDVELDFELRDGVGSVVAQGRRTVTATDGAFTTSFSVPSTTTELDLAWVIGLANDDLVVRSFDGFAPGPNVVEFSDVYEPAVAVVTGTLTRNGVPIGGQIDVTIDVATDGVAPTGGGRVDADPTDGSYRYTEILPRAATTVTAGASFVGTSVSGNAPPLALLPGDNEVVIDLDDVQTVIDVTGTLLIGSDPPPGNVEIEIVAGDGAAQSETSVVNVTPDAGDGSYGFDAVLPAFTSEVTLTARLGTDDTKWPTQTFTGIAVGQNDLTFDGSLEVQVIRVSGDLTIGGDPVPDAASVTVRLLDQTAGGGWGRTATVDVVDGGYEFEVVSPRPSESMRVIVELPASSTPYPRFDQTFPVPNDGLNVLDVDVALEGRGVLVSGTLLDGGQPVTTAQTLFVDGKVAPNALPHWNGSITVNPDATGAFTGFFVVRDDSVSVGHATQIGPFVGDRVRQQTDGIGDGVNEITHDDDYVPPVIDLTGTLAVDGTPVSDDQLFILPSIGNEIVPVSAGGAIDVSFTLPRDQIGLNARAYWAQGLNLDDHPFVQVGPLVAGSNPAVLNADYQTTTVTLSGTIRYRDEVPGGIGVNIDVFMSSTDGAGNYDLGERNVLVTPDPVTGAYDVTFDVASGSEAVNPVILLDGFRSDPYEIFSTVLDTTPGENTVGTLDAQTTSLELSGNITVSGSGGAWADEFFMVDVQASDGGVVLDTIEDVEAFTDGSGDYSIEVFLPLGTDSVQITPDVPGAPPFTETINSSPGVTTATEDFTTAGGDTVSLTLFFEEGGVPAIDLVGYEVVDYGFGPEEFNEVSFDADVPVIEVIGGEWVAGALVDASANFIEIQARYPDPGGGDIVLRRVFDVRGETAPYDLIATFSFGDDRFHLSAFNEVFNPDASGDTFCLLEGATFAFQVTVTAFEDIGAAGDLDPTNEVELFSTIVLPTESQFDPFDTFDLVAPLVGPADGYTFLIVDVDTSPFYDPDIAEAFYGFGYDVGPGVTESINDFYDATCVGEPFGG